MRLVSFNSLIFKTAYSSLKKHIEKTLSCVLHIFDSQFDRVISCQELATGMTKSQLYNGKTVHYFGATNKPQESEATSDLARSRQHKRKIRRSMFLQGEEVNDQKS